MQPGKILLPMDDTASAAVVAKWRSGPLFRKPLCEEAELTPTRELLQVEDVSPEALPTSTNTDTYINPAEKHQQIGQDAGKKLLRGFLQGMESPSGGRCAVLIVDLSLHVCDGLKAATAEYLLSNSGLPTYFLGFAAGEEKLEWAEEHYTSWLSAGFLDGSLPVPKSVMLPPVELSSELVEAAPPQPQLNTLTWNKQVKYEGVPTLKMPPGVLTQYHDHARFGSEFKAMLEQARKDYPLDMPAPDGKDKDSLPKRTPLKLNKVESGLAPAAKNPAAEASGVKLEADRINTTYVFKHCLAVVLLHIFHLP